MLFENISFGVAENQRIAIVAKNGTGKTTLLNIIAGEEDYDSGRITFRNGLRVGYLSQTPTFPEELTVLDACMRSDNEIAKTVAEYEKAMLTPDCQNLEEVLAKMDILKAWD